MEASGLQKQPLIARVRTESSAAALQEHPVPPQLSYEHLMFIVLRYGASAGKMAIVEADSSFTMKRNLRKKQIFLLYHELYHLPEKTGLIEKM